MPERVGRVIVGISVCCPLARLEEVVRWSIDDGFLGIVADDAIARALVLANATGAKEGDVAACDRNSRAGTGDGDAVTIDIRDIDTRAIATLRGKGDFDLGIGRVVGFANEDSPCIEGSANL